MGELMSKSKPTGWSRRKITFSDYLDVSYYEENESLFLSENYMKRRGIICTYPDCPDYDADFNNEASDDEIIYITNPNYMRFCK